MKYRVLGRTGVQVSQLCFGTMSFGGDADEREVRGELEDPPGHVQFSVRTWGEDEDERGCGRDSGDPGRDVPAQPPAPGLVVVDRVEDPGEEVGGGRGRAGPHGGEIGARRLP